LRRPPADPGNARLQHVARFGSAIALELLEAPVGHFEAVHATP
jgi:hypothetical protein